MDELDNKIIRLFPGKVVRKDLTSLMKRGANVPTYVLEYLLGMYCSSDNEDVINKGIEKINNILIENYVKPEESERIKAKIRQKGEYIIIDKISAYLDQYMDSYIGSFSNLDIGTFILPEDYIVRYDKILSGGIWCMARIAYTFPELDENKNKKVKRHNASDSPFQILSIKPIQMPNLDIAEIVDNRKNFSLDEWTSLLLRSSGYEPDELNSKQKMHFIERMVPLVERNYNFCELGPRGTGKSYVYKEISPYSILMSGGLTSTSNLFYNLRCHRVGLVGHWDCVGFDEVAGMNFRDSDIIQFLKDYMASGSFAREHESINADASLVFIGNINDTPQSLLKVTHLFNPFPDNFSNDSAFFDRIHYYLPGWEMPKMKSSILTNKYGLITDCLSEFCKEMRKYDFSHHFDMFFRLNKDFNKRDEIAVRKTFSGLTKLLFPDGVMTEEESRVLLDYAIEGRRRVKEQLKIMSGVEFNDTSLGYIDNYGEETIINVPEQSSSTLVQESKMPSGHVFSVGKSVVSGELCIYKLENKCVSGSGEMKKQGIYNKSVNECITASMAFFKNTIRRLVPNYKIYDHDYLLYYDDTQDKGLSDEVSLAEFIGLCSAACDRAVVPSMVIVGDIKLSGTLSEVENLEDIFRVCKNAGAKKILLPYDCINEITNISQTLLDYVRPQFYRDPIDAARIALEL